MPIKRFASHSFKDEQRMSWLRLDKIVSLAITPHPSTLSLILAAVFLIPAYSYALRAPHAAPKINLCSDCHTRTGAGFATITSQNVLCINALGCHRTGGAAETKSLSLLDPSNRFGNLPTQSGSKQSSHGWKIPNTNTDAGVTQTNKWGEMATGVGKALNDRIGCTRCHRAHGEKTGYVIYNKFLRQSPTGNYICIQCHAARQMDNVRDPLPAGKHYSHPVEVNYSTARQNKENAGYVKDDWFYAKPQNPYSSNPSAALPLFTTVNVDGLGRITGVKGTGQVVCQTCHGPLHSSDSNPYTLDNITTYSKTGNYSTSDGNLLRRYPLNRSNDLCASCHKVQTHKSFLCGRCHAPHKKAGEENRYLIHENISTPNSGRKAVQFISTSHPAQRYGDSNKICQVCHTATKYHRNYSSVAAKRDHNYLGNDTYKFCPDCHQHTRGFSPEPIGSQPCSTSGCHDDYFGQMNAAIKKGYHHYLNNANVNNLASGSKYPVINPPVPLDGKSDQNRRCLQCHVEHVIFKPDLNWQSRGRAYNLRTDISVLPNRTTAGINTDFISKYGIYSAYLRNGLAPNGGICLSCHQNSQFKSYTQPDSTTRTPIINKTLFDDSPHQYEVDSTFDSGATIFKANCSKCHVDNMNKSKQGAGNKFGPHFSNIRRINAAMINESNAGTATSGTTSTVIEDIGKAWNADMWASWPATILEGTGAGQKRKIRSNTATTFTVATAFSPAPNTTSKYLIADSRGIDSGTPSSATSTTIRDNTKTGSSIWKTNYWKNRPVTIVSGTGYGQSRIIQSNTTTSFIVSPAWSPVPDTTSTYSIGDPAEEEVCFRCHSEQTNPNAGLKKDYYGVKTFENSKTLRMEGLFYASNPYRHRIDRYFGKHRADEGVNAPSGATENGWFNTAAGGLHTGCADCHNPHGNRRPGEDNGVATFGTISTLTHSGKGWSLDRWRGYTLRLMDGTGRGQDRMIVKNTADTLKVAATFVSAPGSDTYYIITPIGLPNKGNNLWNPNSGVWGVGAVYSPAGVGSMTSPTFAKNTNLVAGTNKIYELCFKCHSEYGWGTSGTPFTIPDSIVATRTLTEEKTTDVAKEFNPNNLGHHPVIDIGNNQPITAMGSNPQSLEGPFTATGGSSTTLNFVNTWTPNKYSGKCVEITGGTGSGQVKSITGHNTTGITGVDPSFSPAPDATSMFYIRNCSTFSSNWPRFTGGTITLTNGSATATISGLANGIPSTTIAGWYIYAGALSGSPLKPPTLATSGWFQITSIITPGASDSGTGTVDVTITPTPTASYAGAYALTAGLGNTFVPPYGPWSVMGCADCHDTDDSRDPSGPHASARNWMLRTLEAQIFPWYYGGTGEGASTTDAKLVKMIGYPDGNNSGWGSSNMYKYTCLNCHRSDVYGTDTVSPSTGTAPSGSAFINFAWRSQGRTSHAPHASAYYVGSGGNIYGIVCMSCHGGDNRASKSGSQYAALGGIHGSNLGLGGSGGSFRGRRLLNGATWNSVTRATTTSGVSCWYGSNDATSSCGGVGSGTGGTALYPYYSGSDVYMTTMTSAVANNASGGPGGVQTGDKVVIRFDGETTAAAITKDNINTAIALSGGHLWTDGSGNIGSAVWSTTTYTNDTLTITLNTGATVAVGDTITPGGGIIQGITGPITNTRTISGTFNVSPVSAVASDASNGGIGIQGGDRVVIKFDGSMAGTALNGSNIDSALALNNGHFWKDGSNNISSAVWTSDGGNTNDTLTITLNSVSGGKPSVAKGDAITLGTIIKDSNNNTVSGTISLITGSFDSALPGTGIVPAGWWKFNENSGTTTYDETINNNTGTITSATWTTGKFGSSALSFNGSGYRVNVADSNSLDLTSAGSLEAFVKMGAANANKVITAKGSAYKLSLDGSGKIVFTWGATTITSTSTIDQTNWHHIVGTYSGGNLNLYIDGASAATQVTTGSSISANTSQFTVGYDGSTNYFNGTIEEVVVYNVALTSAQVLQRYSPRITSIVASDTSGNGTGIQTGDQVVISFDGVTNGFLIDNSNIDTVLALNNSHLWRAGGINVVSSVWSNAGGKTNDTLTLTLNANDNALVVASGDTVTFNGSILDALNRPIIEPKTISGGFDVPYGSVGFWAFNEATGSTAVDSLNTNNATITSAARVSAGYNGNALSFDGSSSYVSTAASPANLNLTNLGTIELWAKKTANVLNQTYVSKSGTSYILKEDTAGKLVFNWGTDSITSTNPVPLNQWTHIVAVYDGANLTLYSNGSENGTKVSAVNAVANTNALYIGANAGANKFNGLIDQVVIYNKALSAAEVRQRYKIRLDNAVAADTSTQGPGVQAGDTVIIKFKGATNGLPAITSGNIDTVLALGGHSWGTSSGAWTQTTYPNDTLTITLGGTPTVGIGDTITLDGSILNSTGDPIVDSITISGTFGTTSPATPNAVGYWKLDGNANDATANGNNGTPNGSPTWPSPGKYGTNAVTLNGTTGYINVPDSNSLNILLSGTVEAWIKKTANNNNQVYVNKGNAYTLMDSGTTGKILFKWGIGGSVTSNSVLSTGQWHHVVGTYEATTGVLSIYIDGNPTPDVTTTYMANATANTSALKIGTDGTTYFNGTLDEVAVYNRAITPAEVQARYGAWLVGAIASDTTNNAKGIQSGDKVTITFNRPSNGDTISVIDTDLVLNGGHTWGSVTSALWSQTTYLNDTLTVTLNSGGTLTPGDTITLGGTIKDTVGRSINDSITISGNFGTDANEPSGAVGNWKLDENSGTSTADATVNGNTGTLSGSTLPAWTTGRYSYGLSFNGTTAYVNVTDSNSLDLTTDGSVEAWVRMNGSNNNKVILSKGTAYKLSVDGTGKIVFTWGATTITSTSALEQTMWHHIVGTYSGGNLNLYIDGATAATQVTTGSSISANATDLKIGTDGTNFWNGWIDEVVVYNKAVSAGEVLARYGSWLSTVTANAVNNAPGIQSGDQVVVRFNQATNVSAPVIDNSNIATTLVLNGGHSWGTITSATWSNGGGKTNDTLTVTMSSGATLTVGDTITIGGGLIKDTLGRNIVDSMPIGGTFGTAANEPAGAVGNWKFDENSGTTANDSTVNGNTGTLSGATLPTWATGRYSSGLSFNGTTAYVNVPDSNSLDLTGEGSLEAWMNANGNTNLNKAIMSKGSGYKLSVDGTGKIVFTWGSTTITSTSTLTTLGLTKWHHIVGTYKAGNLNLYINKVSAATTVTTGSSISANASSLTVGADGTNFWNGQIDEVVVYNKELTLSDVQTRYGTWLSTATASDTTIAGIGVQGGDQVVVKFSGATYATPPTIDKNNINTALALSGGHSWLDGSGNLGGTGSGVWSSSPNTNDTLTITLGWATSLPTVAFGDTITLDGTIKDNLNRPIVDSAAINQGSFDVPAGAKSYWTFNEGSGTAANDSTATANNGTVTGAAWTAGKFGNALNFNGTSDYVSYPSTNIDYALSGSYTLEAWIKPAAFNEKGAILFNGDGSKFRYNFAVHSDGKLGFSFDPTGGIFGIVTNKSTGTLKLNEWNHVLVTRNGGSGSTATFYINGAASGTFTDNHYATSSAALKTGKTTNLDFDYFFSGAIDNVVIFNSYLSASDVKTRFRTWIKSARATDMGGAHGIQANDKVVVSFDGATNGPTIDSGNMDGILTLNNGHSWGNSTAAWTSNPNANDTLTVTLPASGASVAPGDVITLNTFNGVNIKDNLNRPLSDARIVEGSLSPTPSPGNVQGYWELNETSGTTVIDGTTNNNHGTIYNAVRDAGGKVGSALSFNGSNAYAEMANTNFSLTNALSVEFWMKASDNVPDMRIIAGNAFSIRTAAGNQVNPGIITGGGSGTFQGSGWTVGSNLFNNNWHHLVLTWDGTTQRFYVDGTEVGSSTAGSGQTLTTQTTMRIGREIGTSAFYFTGIIDEVVIYNKTLTPAEVTNRYNNP